MPEKFEEGWKYYADSVSTGWSSHVGEQYCDNVKIALDNLEKELNQMVKEHGNLASDKCKGFVAETWHNYTYRLNQALQDETGSAEVVKSTDLASADLIINGVKYSLKYNNDAKVGAKEQSKNWLEKFAEYSRHHRTSEAKTLDEYLKEQNIDNTPEQVLKSIYEGQVRIVPFDKVDEIKKLLSQWIATEKGKENPNRLLKLKTLQETLSNVKDRIIDENGIESIPLDNSTAEEIARMCKENNLDLSKYGLDSKTVISLDYLAEQALKAGYTAAVMSLVLEVAPKLCNLLLNSIRNGELSVDDLKETGAAFVNGTVLGFVRGYLSCALTIACESGKLGEAFTNVSYNAVAAAVVLVFNTVKNACLVCAGEMTSREMCQKVEDTAITSIATLLGGSIGIAVLPQISVLGYLIGSFVGSVIGTIVSAGKNALILGLCLREGITLFGIVDQDYAIPDEIAEELGIDVVSLNFNEINTNEITINEVTTNEMNKNEIKEIDVTVLRRGVIGVRTIGYIN